MELIEYKGYKIEIDRTGYASKEDMFSFFLDDGETHCGSGESIEDCERQIDWLVIENCKHKFHSVYYGSEWEVECKKCKLIKTNSDITKKPLPNK